jgi:hypothetical protein
MLLYIVKVSVLYFIGFPKSAHRALYKTCRARYFSFERLAPHRLLTPFVVYNVVQQFLWGFLIICDRIWENPAYREFYEILVSYIFETLYHRANLPPSFRLIACFPLEIQRFIYDRAPLIKIEKLRPEGIAIHAYGVSIHYAYTGNQLNGHGRSRSKWTPKVELGSNFIVDNESRFFSNT